MSQYSVKYKEILTYWNSSLNGTFDIQKEKIVTRILRKFSLVESDELKVFLKKKLSRCFFNNYKKNFDKLSKNKRNFETFEDVYKDWLENDFGFADIQSETINTPKQGNKVGRPTVLYGNASEKTKQRRNSTMANSISVEELCDTAKKKLKLDGNKSGSKLIRTCFDQESANELIFAQKSSQKSSKMKKMTAVEALEMLITCNLTKRMYNEIRLRARKHGHDLYPSYKQIVKAKKKAYPPNLHISETRCEVSVQDLMEKTVKSLCDSINIPPSKDNEEKKLVLFVKYGFDGTNTNRYKQKTSENSSVLDYMFGSCAVPLRLVDIDTGEVYWTNLRPSSTRLCRPLKLLYAKETDELCKAEEEDLKMQIDRLTDVIVGGYRIGFKMILSMIDGKVCNALHDTSSQRCFICKDTISHLNDIDSSVNNRIDESALQHGISVLHAHIRFMELVLHISYRMQLQLWRVPKEKEQVILDRKKEIQDGLYEELGILVDFPMQGSGNTNDGNTARRFFNNVEVVAKITGFDQDLLERLKVILAVISSKYCIDSEAFQVYAEDTARRYVSLYEWYYMPPSMHIILIHGYQIINEFLLPIGMLSEEAQESNHKNIKRFRDRFSRKTSRIDTNRDIFQRLLLYSDPYLSLLNQPISKKKKAKNLTDAMKNLLTIPESEKESDDDDSDSDSVGYVDSETSDSDDDYFS